MDLRCCAAEPDPVVLDTSWSGGPDRGTDRCVGIMALAAMHEPDDHGPDFDGIPSWQTPSAPVRTTLSRDPLARQHRALVGRPRSLTVADPLPGPTWAGETGTAIA